MYEGGQDSSQVDVSPGYVKAAASGLEAQWIWSLAVRLQQVIVAH